MLMYRGLSLCGLGRIPEALETSSEAVAEARRINHPYSLAQALSGEISVRILSQELDGAAALITELADVTRAREIVFHSVVAEIQRGYLALKGGAIHESIGVMVRGLDRYRSTGSMLYMPTYQMWLIEALIEDGQYDAAMDEIISAERLMESTGMVSHAAGIAMLRADLHRRRGDRAAAAAAIGQAIEIAARQEADFYVDQYRETLANLGETTAPIARIRA
jgi:ATP/maltotriose-dependent transcriptional regulator MalT